MPILIDKASRVHAVGNKPKLIDEYIGRVNSNTNGVSVAVMESPCGWTEPGQRPEFDEFTVVLRGSLHVKHDGGEFDVNEGQALIAPAGEWIQYSTPGDDGAQYVSVCIPAFSPDTVHRDRN